MVTTKNIARDLHVSQSTVSKALNDKHGIRGSLKLEIQDYAEKIGYKPYLDNKNENISRDENLFIGIIYPASIGSHLIRKVQEGLDSILLRKKYNELWFAIDVNYKLNTMPQRELFLRHLVKSSSLSGLIFMFMDVSDKLINYLHRNDIACISIYSYSNVGKCVYVDNAEMAYEVTSNLIKLGRKNIGIVIPDENSSTVWEDRLKGYIKALLETDIEYNPSLIYSESTFLQKNAALTTARMVRENPCLDAIIYSGDSQAFAGIKTLKNLGKRIPDDIAVIGFDNMDFDLIVEPSLSSVEQPLKKMGQQGAKLLMKMIRQRDYTPEVIKFKSRIILRRSCLKDYVDKKWA